MEEDILSTSAIDEDIKEETKLRPERLDDFIGQVRLKDNLKIFIEAALKREEPLDHSLFYGPPGLGKTTLAHIIAKEMGTNLKSTSGPVLDKVGDLAAILTDLMPGDVLFVDEIHRMNYLVEESLYSVLEDFKLDIIIGEGPSAKNIKLDIPKFTLIGATTRAGLLASPLRDRFGIINHLDFYNFDDLNTIIRRTASIFNCNIDEDASKELAKRSRATPRVANRLVRRVRDFAEVKNDGYINSEIVNYALDMLNIDSFGLDGMDRKILEIIIKNYSGGPVGIDTIAVAIGEETDTISDVYEPYLIQIGFIARTPRGRMATRLAYDHLGLPFTNKVDNLYEKTLLDG